ncbi:hypothetical protein BA724_12300 [Domibacillus iocasae]|uniref:Uncharacterized protein n=1 Tax=Domibacillus iocasae TaxID=1714016 RepID=A0A1E7DMF7_9BACI|nr:hypothetical protein BA724_12300 [Domibacillus iocasae]
MKKDIYRSLHPLDQDFGIRLNNLTNESKNKYFLKNETSALLLTIEARRKLGFYLYLLDRNMMTVI